jgi:signal transduction histidine kinase
VLQFGDARAHADSWWTDTWCRALGVRFFAGTALRTPSGHVVGMLCVMDASAPRAALLSSAQAGHLCRLARQVVCTLELGRAVSELARAGAALRAAAEERTALRAARAAARADADAQRVRFVHLVADEVRAPLNGIASAVSSLALADAPPEQPALEALAVRCTHLQLGVDSILDYGVEEQRARGAATSAADAAAAASAAAAVRLPFRITPEPVSVLGDVLAPALRLVQHIHTGAALRSPGGAAGARVLHSIGPGVPARVVCDASRAVSILTKLLNNGLKHVATAAPPEGGTVTLAVLAEADALLFHVADDGCGIAPDALATLFDADGGRERGLAASRRLAQAMGGDISAQSDGPGRGATFILRLPLVTPPGTPPRALSSVSDAVVFVIGAGAPPASASSSSSDPAPPTPVSSFRSDDLCAASPAPPDAHSASAEASAGAADAPPTRTPSATASTPRQQHAHTHAPRRSVRELKPGQRADGAPLRLLVAEDDRVSQVIVKKLLAHVGAEVLLVGDGAAAVEAYRAAPDAFDLILLDVNMPILDGTAAARAINAMGNTTPIIALTANTGPDAVQRCLEAGMSHHLGKPVRPETLSTLRPYSERRDTTPEDESACREWLARNQ